MMNAESKETRPETSLVSEMPEGEEKPPRGTKAMAWLRWLLLLGALGAALYTNVTHFVTGSSHAASAEAKYYCPMHPQITSDRPGECPICHMSLEPIPTDRLSSKPAGSAEAHHGHGHGHEDHAHGEPSKGAGKYICPMCPEVVNDGPGRCPICRMYLEPVRDEKSMQVSGDTPFATPSGTVPVVLSFDRVQAIGVRTSLVTKHDARAPLRVTASVSAPEQGQAFVHSRASGHVERASVQQTGIRVKRGQELLAIYSPEIYQAQSELLAARAWKGPDGSSPQADAARTKLELLGVSRPTIDRVIESGKPIRAVSIVSPVDGWVVKKSAALGSYVTPEMTLFEIVDLSHVYVTAEVFQRDAHRVTLGTEARFLPIGRDDKAIVGKVDLVYPTLSPKERTTRIRMRVSNRNAELRPGDYGSLELSAPARDTLVVPRDAIVDTGSTTYVFVVEGEGRYVPRVVALGADFDDLVEVKGGVWEGEKVVSSATFLIDSESRLQASLAGHGASANPHAGHGH